MSQSQPVPWSTPFDILEEVDNLDPALATDAAAMVDEWRRWERGLSPRGAAAAAYFAASLRADVVIGQEEVATLFEVTPVTVREWYQEVIEATGGWSDVPGGKPGRRRSR